MPGPDDAIAPPAPRRAWTGSSASTLALWSRLAGPSAGPRRRLRRLDSPLRSKRGLLCNRVVGGRPRPRVGGCQTQATPRSATTSARRTTA